MVRRGAVGLAVVLVLTAAAAGQDNPNYGLSQMSHLRVGKGKDAYGHCGLCVVSRGGRAIAAFTLVKQPGEDSRYAYLLIFPPSVGTGIGAGGSVTGSNTELTLDGQVDAGKHEVPIKYKAKFDDATNKLVSETITLAGMELKKGDPRVYLVDVSGERPKLTPVKVDLPKSVPDLTEDEAKAWGAAVDKGLDQLKEKSPEVKAFLAPKGK